MGKADEIPKVAKKSHASWTKERNAKWDEEPTGDAWMVHATANDSRVEKVRIEGWDRGWPIISTAGARVSISKARLWFHETHALLDLFIRKKRRAVSLSKQAVLANEEASRAFDNFSKALRHDDVGHKA